AGVTLKQGAIVRTLRAEGKKLKELELEDDRSIYTADFFIGATASPLAELVAGSRYQGKLALQEQAYKPSGSLLVLNLLVAPKVIPMGMGRAIFLLNGRRHHRENLPKDPPLLVERFSTA